MKRVFLGVILGLWVGSLAAQATAPLRRFVVLEKGQRVVYATASPVVTVSNPPGADPNVVRSEFQQYGQEVGLQGLKTGEAKVLVENTASQISEVVNVVVVDKPVADRYRLVTASLSGIEGISPETIPVAGSTILIGGNVYSVADYQRCAALANATAAAAAKPKKGAAPVTTVCAAHLSSATPAVYPQTPVPIGASVELTEEPQKISGATQGMEGPSTWHATIRLGDVPIASLASQNRPQIVLTASQFAQQLNRAIAEWKAQAEKGSLYPVSVSSRPAGSDYEISMRWKFSQGTKGETLAHLTAEQTEAAAARSGRGPGGVIAWWSALLEDAFRMYVMANRPMRSGADDSYPLSALYRKALTVSPGTFDRTTAPAALARAWFATSMAAGKDPFDSLLVQPPASFQ